MANGRTASPRTRDLHSPLPHAGGPACGAIHPRAPNIAPGSTSNTEMPTETLRTCVIDSEMMRRPLGSTVVSILRGAWVRRKEATPLPGAAGFLTRVRQLGGRIAIVTNRLESECEDTRVLFQKLQLPFDAMLCRPDKGSSDKNPRFEAVAMGKAPAGPTPLKVIAFVGDNILDFPALAQAARQQGDKALSEFGARFFLVPNPMYGSWER